MVGGVALGDLHLLSNAALRGYPFICGYWHQIPTRAIGSVGCWTIHNKIVDFALELY